MILQFYLKWTNWQEIVIFIQIMGPGNKIHNFKNMMSSGKKIKKHMESELSGIFQLKLVAKNGIWFLRDPFYVYAD